ncbi:MAG TPA: hypothetical protein VGL82_18060 [Bryobacteraceae bacterium]|jgi:hypothetical protein
MRLHISFPILLVTIALGFADSAHAQGRGTNAPRSPAQAAMERMQPDQTKIRDLANSLKQAILELNRLRRIPQNDPDFKSVSSAIAAQDQKILKLAAVVYGLAKEDGLADAIVNQERSLQALLANGLPARERQVLSDAGFSELDIAELSVTVQLKSAESLPHLDTSDQRKKLDSAGSKISPASVIKIAAGALLISVDIGSRFIPLLNAVTAFEAFGSVAGGMEMVADGLEPKPAAGR